MLCKTSKYIMLRTHGTCWINIDSYISSLFRYMVQTVKPLDWIVNKETYLEKKRQVQKPIANDMWKMSNVHIIKIFLDYYVDFLTRKFKMIQTHAKQLWCLNHSDRFQLLPITQIKLSIIHHLSGILLALVALNNLSYKHLFCKALQSLGVALVKEGLSKL